MRVSVLERTPDRMVIRSGPWWGWWSRVTRILGWVLLLLGLLSLAGSIDQSTLRCERGSADRCEIVQRTLFGTERRGAAVSELTGVALRPPAADAGGARSRAVLLADGQEVLFAEYGEGEASEMQGLVTRIEEFIRAPEQQRLELTFSHTLGGVILSGLVLLIAWWCGWWGRVTTLVFDRTANTCQLRRRGLITTRRTRPLDTVEGVEVRSRRQLSGGRYVENYVVSLHYHNRGSTTLDSTTDRGAAHQLAGQIRSFLGRGQAQGRADGEANQAIGQP